MAGPAEKLNRRWGVVIRAASWSGDYPLHWAHGTGSLPGEAAIAQAGGGGAARDEAGDATRGSLIKVAAELSGRVLGLATTLVLARALGVEGFGFYAVVSGLALIAAEVSDLGLTGTASRALVAGTYTFADLAAAKARLLGVVIVAAAIATVAAFLVPPVAPYASPFAALLLAFAAVSWVEFAGASLRSMGHRWHEALALLALRGTALALALAALWHGWGIVAVAWTQAAAAAAGATVALAMLHGVGLSLAGGEAGTTRWREALRVSLPIAANSVLALGSMRIETLAVAAWRGTAEAGLYAAALRIVEMLSMFPSAVSAGAMPALTREAGAGGDGARRRTARTIALLAVPCAVGLALVSPGAVRLAYGADYAAAAPVLAVLALAIVPMHLNALQLNGLLASGHVRALPGVTVVRLGTAVALALVLPPLAGAAGAAAGFALSELALTAAAARAGREARFAVPLAAPVGEALLATLPMALVVGWLRPGPVQAVALGAAIYTVTVGASWRLRQEARP